MQITMIRPRSVKKHWRWMAPLLAPAIAVDPEATTGSVKSDLINSVLSAWECRGDGYAGIIVTCMGPTAWIYYAGGEVDGGPKRSLQRYREIMGLFEIAAKRGGAKELRIRGRATWARIFTDYDLIWKRGSVAELRKVL